MIINWEDDHCDLDGYDEDYYDYYCDSDDYYYVILEMVSRIIILIMIRRFRLAMHDMIGYYPSYFFVACWSVITPAICAGVFFFKVFVNIIIIVILKSL